MEDTGLEHRITVTTTLVYVGGEAHDVAHRLVESFKGFARKHVVLGIDRHAATVTAAVDVPTELEARGVSAVGPQQLNKQSETLATVSYPVGETTVLSMQPDGRIEVRPAGTVGPYETCLVSGDRLIYAPTGVGGPVFLLPFAAQIPNA